MSLESIYNPELAIIKHAEALTEAEKLFEIQLASGKPLCHKPGQFVEISVFGVGEAPISVSSSPTRNTNTFELVVRKVGNVTTALHNLEVGATVGIRGPFGTSFPCEEIKGRDILVIAGGIGLVPARSLIHYVLDNRSCYGRLIILFGAKTPKEQLFTNELQEWRTREDIEYHETVDKADRHWKAKVGVITTLFHALEIDPSRTTAIIVGPPIMYRFVLLECKNKGLNDEDIILSLERRMKCGVGKCGHCQINGIYVCQEGPVFRYSQIKDVDEAL